MFEDIVAPDTRAVPIEGVGTFYYEDSHSNHPDWVRDFFGASLDRPDVKLFTSSAKGLLLVRVSKGGANYIFAVMFGFGRFLLRDGVIEERFGLKVVLNSVSHRNLRSIDRTSLGSVPKQSHRIA
jgi:uncharacterized protein (TIGR04141 family)